MKKLKAIISALEGKKTYIVAVVIAVLNLAAAMNWISPDNLAQINTVLGALGMATIRAGLKKV